MSLKAILPLAFIVLAMPLACGDDMAKQGFRDPCASPSGAIDGCDMVPVETSQDVCWRLVECGAIPLEDPPDSEGIFDWQDCVGFVDDMDSYQFELSASCVQLSSCDDLKPNGAPNAPYSVPLCLRHGDQ